MITQKENSNNKKNEIKISIVEQAINQQMDVLMNKEGVKVVKSNVYEVKYDAQVRLEWERV